MSIRDDIYSYESKLSELKKELNDLTRLYLSDPKSNSKLLSSKINSMQNEIKAIDYQLNLLKISLPGSSNVNQINQEPKTSPQENNYTKIQSNYERPKAQPASNINTHSNKSFTDLENTIGKSFMGILASILIFISLILFAKLLYPLLTNAIKIIAMYLLSIGFTFFGLLKLKKKPKNKLYLSIAGCGVGALYISLILSNVYFKIIGDITLYLLILAWAIFTSYLSRLKSNIFGIIGKTGISIALIFGSTLCLETNDAYKFFILTIFFVITSFIFSTSKVYSKNLVNNIFNLLNLFIMTVQYFEISSSQNLATLANNSLYLNIIPYIFIAFIAYTFITSYTIFKLDEKNIDFCVLNISYLLILLEILSELLTTNTYLIIGFIMLFVILIMNEIKFKNNKCIAKDIFQIILMLYLASCCFEIKFIADYVGTCILAIPFIIYGFYAKDDIFKYAGLTALAIYTSQLNLYNVYHFIIGLIIFALLKFLISKEKEQYSSIYKIITYLLFMIFIASHLSNLFGTNYNEKEIAIFAFLSILNLIAAKSSFKTNFATGETENSTLLVTQIINALLMLWSLNLIEDSAAYSVIMQTVIISISLALFIANTRNLLKKYDGLAAGIYIGIKLTVLMLVILDSWEASNFVISISCLIFAILGIVLGFCIKQKSFRIYGLGLTMISTIKLIMIDITYENSIGHALSFFLSGILCFAISAIYNLIDKKIIQEKK